MIVFKISNSKLKDHKSFIAASFPHLSESLNNGEEKPWRAKTKRGFIAGECIKQHIWTQKTGPS